MSKLYTFLSNTRFARNSLNRWDLIAFLLVLGILAAFVWGAKQMASPYELGQSLPISLDPMQLPKYALFTVLRLVTAMVFSLLFTFTVGTLAAKNKRAASFILPCIDVLQSVPVIGFLSITVIGFIVLFHGSRLGPEAAAIFAIFTAQVWNITLSFYQSLRSVPLELKEAADMFHLSAWQRFWRVEVPFSIPGLLWNMMLSMSGSWIFLIASESISVNQQTINLPGIGSYLGLAISQSSVSAVLYTILTMLIVILIYDQLFFRPLLHWSKKFTFETVSQIQQTPSWLTLLLQRSQLAKYCGHGFAQFSEYFVNLPFFTRSSTRSEGKNPYWNLLMNLLGYGLLTACLVGSFYLLLEFIIQHIAVSEIMHVFGLGLVTMLRVLVVTLLCSVIWVPLGVWIGLNPRAAVIVQPVAQFLAAFPTNVLFPIVVILILKYHLNVNIWVTPLMLLGTQWYILFNVVAGASALPEDLKQATANFGVKGWQWWRHLILPGIFPYWITGTLTAVGNCWNTSIIAEAVSWGSTTLVATGLGAYITQKSALGDFPRVALGIAVMSVFVFLMNRLIWQPLYRLAQSRYKFD